MLETNATLRALKFPRGESYELESIDTLKEALMRNTTLRALTLNITPDGAVQLADVLRYNSTTLNLSWRTSQRELARHAFCACLEAQRVSTMLYLFSFKNQSLVPHDGTPNEQNLGLIDETELIRRLDENKKHQKEGRINTLKTLF